MSDADTLMFGNYQWNITALYLRLRWAQYCKVLGLVMKSIWKSLKLSREIAAEWADDSFRAIAFSIRYQIVLMLIFIACEIEVLLRIGFNLLSN